LRLLALTYVGGDAASVTRITNVGYGSL